MTNKKQNIKQNIFNDKTKGGHNMKLKKIVLGSLSAVLSLSLLFGCSDPSQDEQEPDPSEEPSEQNDEIDQDDDKSEMQEEKKDN
jgi:hypothetical protein